MRENRSRLRLNSEENRMTPDAGALERPEVPEAQRKIRWFWGLLASCGMVLLSLYPQVQLWRTHDKQITEVVAYNHGLGDEVAYAAYINALIEGRPRRNDPYTGR